MSEVLLHLYALVPPQDNWTPFLDAIRSIYNAWNAAMLLVPDNAARLGLYAVSVERPSEQTRRNYTVYADSYFQSDPFVGLPPLAPVTLHEYLGERRLADSEYYQQFLKPAGTHYILGADIPCEAGFTLRFRVARGQVGQDFDEDDKAFTRLLIPHFSQVGNVIGQYDHLKSEQRVYGGAMEQLAVGSLLVKADGTICGSNRIADEVLNEADGIAVERSRLAIDDARIAREFNQALRSMCDVSTQEQRPTPTVLRIQRPSGKADLGLVMRPVKHDPYLPGAESAVAAVLMSDPDRAGLISEAALRDLFELTRMEALLARRLAEGLSVTEAADALGIAVNTARSHLRAIFEKTGTQRQAQLIRLVLRSVAELAGYPG